MVVLRKNFISMGGVQMKRFGIFLLVIGIGTFILPYMGLQFKIMSIFGDNQGTAAIVAAVVGLILIALDTARNKKQNVEEKDTAGAE
jgi:hypothetical protein